MESSPSFASSDEDAGDPDVDLETEEEKEPAEGLDDFDDDVLHNLDEVELADRSVGSELKEKHPAVGSPGGVGERSSRVVAAEAEQPLAPRSTKKAPRSPAKSEAELGFSRGPLNLVECENCIRAAMNKKKDKPPPTGDCWSVAGDESPSAVCFDCRVKKQSCILHGADIHFAWSQYKPYLQRREVSKDSEKCRRALKTLLANKRKREEEIVHQKRQELEEALAALTPGRVRCGKK